MTYDPDAERLWSIETRLTAVEDQQNECRECGAIYASRLAAESCETEDRRRD